MLGEHIEFDGIVGVGRVQLKLSSKQHVYTFIGANGVGKTRTLEAIFQLLYFSNKLKIEFDSYVRFKVLKFSSAKFLDEKIIINKTLTDSVYLQECFNDIIHSLPVVYLGAQARGIINHEVSSNQESMGDLDDRRKRYFANLDSKMVNDFSSLNMDTKIEDWFLKIARSTNPYQKSEDSRGIEIKTVMTILNKIDNRIDPDFLEITGDDRVYIKIEEIKSQITQLSSGFTSILKLVQAIVSGYGYFTNEINIQNVKGYVLIDEIESHLHLSWQVNIIPLLKKLFPNTIFIITTHSSVVLSQLKEGEAYKLYRDNDGVVKNEIISSPNKAALADILKDVFNVDLNKIKIDNSSIEDQSDAKSGLLDLINKSKVQ